MTVLDVIRRGTEYLARHGVESPRRQVELLLAGALEIPRLQLYLQFDRELPEAVLSRLREWVQRRGRREPLQHILGSACFCGLELRVSRHVLVPRPETELLAQEALERLRRRNNSAPVLLDFGTGSGCLAIFLAKECPEARVYAVDISSEALAVAADNAARQGVAGRVVFLAGDGFAPLAGDLRFDGIVANPPYIPSAEIASLEPEVRDFDPPIALDGGSDGLDFHRRLAGEAGAYLRPEGFLLVELGDGQAAAVTGLFAGNKWIVESIANDYSGRPRILSVCAWTVS